MKENEDERDDVKLGDSQALQRHLEQTADPSPLPQKPIPYEPRNHDTQELRLDWPNTPLTSSGLTESVIQKVTWLARRLPHGHWTPSQIAERYEEGHMIRFASEDEKTKVLELAAQLANARADKMTERTQQAVDPKDMSFQSLMDGKHKPETMGVLDAMARGVYQQPGKQERAFMDGIVKKLSMNETYKGIDADKFMGRVRKLIGSVTGGSVPKGKVGEKRKQ
jgi:hypothetical protein